MVRLSVNQTHVGLEHKMFKTPCVWNKFFSVEIFNTLFLSGAYKFLARLDKRIALSENGSASGVSKCVSACTEELL